MALVVEDGTGLPNADSYQEVADIAAYAVAHGLAWAPADSAAAEGAARRATTYLDGHYRTQLPGSKVNGRDQSLEWPRTGAYDRAGQPIDDESVPREWLSAHSEAAVRELARPGSLTVDVTPGRVKKSVSISGAVAVTYADEGGVVASQQVVIPVIDNLLSGLLGDTTSGRSVVKFLSRA